MFLVWESQKNRLLRNHISYPISPVHMLRSLLAQVSRSPAGLTKRCIFSLWGALFNGRASITRSKPARSCCPDTQGASFTKLLGMGVIVRNLSRKQVALDSVSTLFSMVSNPECLRQFYERAHVFLFPTLGDY